MNETTFVKSFSIHRPKFQFSHVNGRLLSFQRPCIGYVLAGKAEFLYRGKTYVANQGDIIYIAAGTSYYSVWSGEPDIEFFSVDFSFTNPHDKKEYSFQIIRSDCGELLHEIESCMETDFLRGMGLFYQFLARLYPELHKSALPPSFVSVAPAVRYLEDNYIEHCSVNALAKMCNFSESRFFALFKDAVGCTPVEYKNSLLIQHAMELLTQTDLSVSQISEKLGFSTCGYFRKVCKSLTGMRPKDIRHGIGL